MSKFIERLQQVLMPPVQSMGFNHAKTEQARPKIQLVVNITGNKAKSQIKELAGADALLFSNSAVSLDEKITGMWLSKGNAEEVEKAIKTGVDFVVLPASGEVLAPDKKLGKIIQIEESITDIMLRTIGELPVDAVFLSESTESNPALNWKRLMLIRRFTGLAGKPVLIEVLPTVTETELQQIWDAGVSGVIVKTDAEQAEEITSVLRKIIEKLSFPSKRKNDKNMAIVPVVANVPEEPKEDDGDDGDDDDE
jgi:thiamine monophosphate synthase